MVMYEIFIAFISHSLSLFDYTTETLIPMEKERHKNVKDMANGKIIADSVRISYDSMSSIDFMNLL